MTDFAEGFVKGAKEDEGTALAIYGPLDALVAEYRMKRADIVRIAGYVAGETEVIGYFMEGARVEESFSHFSATKLFEEGHAVRALDASFWSRAIALTDVLELMPADERNNWSEGIRSHKTPAFDPGTVKSTLEVLLSKRAEFFAARVDGLFRALSDVHLTNQPEGFAKRMILNWMLSYGSINHRRCNYIHDLRAVCSRFMGRDDPTSISTYQDLERIVRSGRFGEWHSFDGGAFKVRLYKKATAHLEVAPELAWRLNQILAFKNPMAIPSEFRRKPT
ncbi:MAG: DUF4942 domain-containing protein [Proteobacteria bacterium]|nr:DUF4942 domain-containing protein [Pseudomonadota bacterium]